MKTIQIRKTRNDAILPVKAHETDAGYDVFAAETVIISPGETVKIPLGFAVKLPKGTVMDVRPRSGITSDTPLRIQYGTVDAGYIGEVSAIVDNIGFVDGTSSRIVRRIDNKPELMDNYYALDTYIVRKGDKIAQVVITKLAEEKLEEVTEEFEETPRGKRGFGSTGTKSGFTAAEISTQEALAVIRRRNY